MSFFQIIVILALLIVNKVNSQSASKVSEWYASLTNGVVCIEENCIFPNKSSLPLKNISYGEEIYTSWFWSISEESSGLGDYYNYEEEEEEEEEYYYNYDDEESSERPRPFQQIGSNTFDMMQLCPNGYHQVPITQNLNYYREQRSRDKWYITINDCRTGDPDKCIYTDEREGRVHGTFLDMNSIRSYLIEALDDEKYYIFSKCKKNLQNEYVVDIDKKFESWNECTTDGKFCYIEKFGLKADFWEEVFGRDEATYYCTKLTPHQFCRRPMLDPRKEHVKTCPQGYICNGYHKLNSSSTKAPTTTLSPTSLRPTFAPTPLTNDVIELVTPTIISLAITLSLFSGFVLYKYFKFY